MPQNGATKGARTLSLSLMKLAGRRREEGIRARTFLLVNQYSSGRVFIGHPRWRHVPSKDFPPIRTLVNKIDQIRKIQGRKSLFYS